jgi:hypothetical protein
VEPRYEDSALLRYVAHSHDSTRSRRNTGKTTDRRYEAARSGEAEGTRWLQARWNGQRDEALGGRMHGDAGAKNRYASRRVESDVGPRRDGRGHSKGSAVAPQFMCNLLNHHQPSRDHRAVPGHEPLCRQPAANAQRVS